MDRHTHYAQVGRLEVVDTEQRWRWSSEEKLKNIAESFAAARQVSVVARRYGISPSLLFAWRRRLLACEWTPTERRLIVEAGLTTLCSRDC